MTLQAISPPPLTEMAQRILDLSMLALAECATTDYIFAVQWRFTAQVLVTSFSR